MYDGRDGVTPRLVSTRRPVLGFSAASLSPDFLFCLPQVRHLSSLTLPPLTGDVFVFAPGAGVWGLDSGTDIQLPVSFFFLSLLSRFP